MNAYTIEPEVAGGLGADTVMDTSVHPPRVDRLVYEFAGWLGDDLLEAFPCFIVTERLAEALRDSGLTGFQFAELAVSTTPEFAEHYRGPLPRFLWLKVHGRPGIDDLWVDDSHLLNVTGSALALLRATQIANAVVEPVGSVAS